MKLRPVLLLIFAAMVAVPALVNAGFQQQRGQIFINIEIDVTPAPIALNARPAQKTGFGIVAQTVTKEVTAVPRANAESLSFVGGGMVAQAAAQQKALRVDAEVSPNPNATLITTNNCSGSNPQPGSCNHVQVTITAGQTITVSCAYQVAVSTTQTSWTLDHGLFTDFEDQNSAFGFPGTGVKNSTYAASPGPAFTPFVVYSNDSHVWATVGTGVQHKTYCVDLRISVPASVAGGSYFSNATYTLFY